MTLALAPQCCCLTCNEVFSLLGFSSLPPSVLDTAAAELTIDATGAGLTDANCSHCDTFNGVFIDPTAEFLGGGLIGWRVTSTACTVSPPYDYWLCVIPCAEADPSYRAYINIVTNRFGFPSAQADFIPRDFDGTTVEGRHALWYALLRGQDIVWVPSMDVADTALTDCHDAADGIVITTLAL